MLAHLAFCSIDYCFQKFNGVLQLFFYGRYLTEHSIQGVHISQFSFQTPKPLRADYVRKRPRRTFGGLELSRPLEPAEGVYYFRFLSVLSLFSEFFSFCACVHISNPWFFAWWQLLLYNNIMTIFLIAFYRWSGLANRFACWLSWCYI